jgi:hypothetical protein
MEIPDNVRQTLAAVARYHFWILAALVPVCMMPVLSMGSAALTARIAAQRQKIRSTLGQIDGVTNVRPHPNAEWAKTVDAEAARIVAETQAEWQRLWESQAALRTWPDDLGVDDFLPAVTGLAPGGKLERKYLQRYQKLAPRFARGLPARLGVREEMVDGAAAEGPTARVADRPGAVPPRAPVTATWNPADQKRLYESFVWDRPPTTTQVLVAQEELWVLGALCDLVGQFNARNRAAESGDVPLTRVIELAAGYNAALNPPGGVGESRLRKPRIFDPEDENAGSGEGLPPPPDAAEFIPAAALPTEQKEQVVNPRFTPGSTSKKEEDYRNLVYVDFAGKPLAAAELATAPDARMVHLMPFVLKGTVDQRKLDALLVSLTASDVPVDVREVRINPGVGSGAAAGLSGLRPESGEGVRPRPYDVFVELRGTVALATPPQTPTDAAAPAPVENAP